MKKNRIQGMVQSIDQQRNTDAAWKEYVMAKCGPISAIRSRDEAVDMAQTMADLYGQSIVDEYDRMEKARAGDE